MPGGSTCNRIFGVSDGRVVPLHAPPSGLEDLVGVAAPSCPCRIVLVSEAVSTNLLALSLADSLADGDVVLAGAQSAGRGRLGRDWHSPPGNLYLTFALRPSCDPRIVTALTIVAAVALADAVAPFVDPPPAIRWPNDLLLGGRKAAGILAQTLPEGGGRFVALGVGINVVTPEGGFPEGLRTPATSMTAGAGRAVARREILAAFLESFTAWRREFAASGLAPIVAARRGFFPFLGGPIMIDTGGDIVAGTAEGLRPDGGLIVRTAEGRTVEVVAGEPL